MQLTPFLLILFTLLGCSNYRVYNDPNGIQSNDAAKRENPYVVMISIDGFRHDYIKKYKPQFLSSIVTKGIQSKSLTPVFPSKTFPNHYSLATGMYAGNHGLIANRFYDPSLKEHYRLGDPKSTRQGKWYGGTPLWLETRNQGLLSASFFWVGSDANIQGHYPNYYIPYDGSVKNTERTKQIVEWLKLPKETRPHFLTLYFSDVDSKGHMLGPDNPVVGEAVRDIDKHISNMVKEIDKLNLPVSYVIVSDHGMQAIENAKKVYLRDYVDVSLADFQERGPLTFIYLKDKRDISSYRKALSKVPYTKIYSRKELPAKFHLAHNQRAGDLILLGEPGSYIYPKRIPKDKRHQTGVYGGTHGYDPYKASDMGGIFLSFGHKVKNKGMIKSIENIHVYPFVLDLLELSPKKGIDGKRSILAPYVKR